MSRPAREIGACLDSLDVPERRSVIRRLEALTWGAPVWRFLAWIFDNRAEKILESSADLDQYRLDAELDRAVLARYGERYGRFLNADQMAWAKHSRANGATHLSIRDAVIGRLLTRQGKTKLSPWRRWLLLILGATWHAIAIQVSAFLAILVVMLPGQLEAKLVAALAILAFGVFSALFINALTIRPALAYGTIARAEIKAEIRKPRAL